MKHLLTVLFFFLVISWTYAPNIEKRLDAAIAKEAFTVYQIDLTAIAIQSVLKLVESNGNYKAIGQNGEIGAYQYCIETWNYISTLLFGKVLDISVPENQDLVTKTRIKRLLKLGYNTAQIASIWNCGSSVWEGKKGYNKEGVYYDVPAYVNKVCSKMNNRLCF